MIDLITTASARDEADRNATIALLPVGSFEQHGDHLPLATDTIVACAIAATLAETRPVLVLPPLTITCSHEHSAWRGTVSISARTLHRLVTDIADSVLRDGVEHLVLVNGHGGNYVLSNVVQEYTAAHGPVMSLFPQTQDWVRAREEAGLQTTNHSDMHGGELETSILLHTQPDQVRPGYETADTAADNRRALLTHGTAAYTKTGIIGQPSQASAAKGSALLGRLAAFFIEHLEAIRPVV